MNRITWSWKISTSSNQAEKVQSPEVSTYLLRDAEPQVSVRWRLAWLGDSPIQFQSRSSLICIAGCSGKRAHLNNLARCDAYYLIGDFSGQHKSLTVKRVALADWARGLAGPRSVFPIRRHGQT
jgi:hypothetical protein